MDVEQSNHDSEFYLEYDIGNLCVTKIVKLKASARDGEEDELKRVAAHGASHLLREIFKLPSSYHEHVPVGKLPEPTTILPREKPVPQERAPTKWEKFAKQKGIQRKKKDKLVWDEQSKDWKPTYGFHSANNDQKDWLIEVPENGDPNADYFGKKKEEKKERVAKNELKRLKNIAAASKIKVTNMESVDLADKQQLSRSLSSAKASTASLGRFAETLSKEKPVKNSMKKRLFKPNFGCMTKERENNLKILEDLGKKVPKLDVQEAVQRYMAKPIKEGRSEEEKSSHQKKLHAKKRKFEKNQYRKGGKKFPKRT